MISRKQYDVLKYTALFFLLVAAFSFVSCGGESDSQDCPFKKKFNPETGDFDICPDAPVTSAGQTPTPVIPDKNVALQELWVKLTRCVDLKKTDLEVQITPGGTSDDWLITPSEYSPQEFGTWKVNMWSGLITPHNNQARTWRNYIDAPEKNKTAPYQLDKDGRKIQKRDPITGAALYSDSIDDKGQIIIDPNTKEPTPNLNEPIYEREVVYCDTDEMEPAATDVITETEASTVLWTELAKCHPEIPVASLIARRNQETGDWLVVSDPKYSMDDFGVWSVSRNADITPVNDRAIAVWTKLDLSPVDSTGKQSNEMRAKCTPVIRNADEAKSRMFAFLSPCYPNLGQSGMTTTRDPEKHVWIVVTDEPPADVGSPSKSSVWSVDGEGTIEALNNSSTQTRALIDNNKC